MRIAVTGGSGYVGQSVCRLLMDAGHEVRCVDREPPPFDLPYTRADLRDEASAVAALRNVDHVVHLAAIPNPYGVPAGRVMSVNTATSLHVFEAARQNGIQRVVYACSESATGFGIHHVNHEPTAVPVDETHPCWPHETYSLSKYFGEVTGQEYARAYGMQVLSLRYTWVWFRHELPNYVPIAAAKRDGSVPESPWFGAYISVMDVARAVCAAVAWDCGLAGAFEAFLLTARDTFYPIPTLEVLGRIYGHEPVVADPEYFAANPYASVFDIRKAEKVLGWCPEDLVDSVAEWSWF